MEGSGGHDVDVLSGRELETLRRR